MLSVSRTSGEVDPDLGRRLPLRILVVEDMAINQRIICALLNRLGYSADVAGNGVEALQALERHDYDLILLDVQMPVMDGLACAREMVRRYAQRPGEPTRRPRIVALTDSPGDVERCQAAGMDDHLDQPVGLDRLRLCLERWGQERARQAQASSSSSAHAGETAGLQAELLDMEVIGEMRQLEQPGETGLVQSFIDGFQRTAAERLPLIREAIAGGQAARLHQLAHGLKGTAANVGARAVAACCFALERLGRSGSVTGGEGLLDDLETKYHQTVEAYAQLMAPAAKGTEG